jgi:OOP family OmpA-OmpF porin
MRRLAFLVAALIASTALAVHDNALPSWFPVQGLFSVNPDNTVAEEFGKTTFKVAHPGSNDSDEVEASGHHYKTNLYPAGDSSQWTAWDGEAKWKALRPKLEKLGFQVVYLTEDKDDGVRATLRKGAGDAATYVWLSLSASDAYSNWLEIVEAAPASLTVALKPPAAKPETVGEHDDFPFLTRLPGASLLDTQSDSIPMDVAGPGDSEPHLVGTGVTMKIYRGPEGLSDVAFVGAYAPALEKAGWTVVEKNPDQGSLTAHYAKNGREIWISMKREIDRWTLRVADVGSSLRADLAKQCKVAVYGVNFDFDKATLRPDAEPVLAQVLAVFKADPKLSVEIGGHTDNVGKSDYNLKLSARRADAMKAWLVKHGVSSARLTTRGYGDSMPIEKNDSDAGRAKNRRVELKKPDCR